MLQGHLHHGEGAEHVVEHAFARVGFHHGHVFVGRGVVHKGRAVLRANVLHALRIARTGQQGHQLAAVCALVAQGLQLVVDGVERVFAVLHQQQLRGAFVHDLAAQLAADAASGPGHQHYLARKRRAQQAGQGGHGLAADEVFQPQVLEIGHRHAAAGQVRQARQRADAQRQLVQALQNGAAALARCAGHGQQHVGDAQALHQVGQGVRAVHAHAVDAAAHLDRVVVHKAHQLILAHAGQTRCRLCACAACSVDQKMAWGLAWLAGQPQPSQRTAGAYQQQKNQWLQDTHAAWHALPLGQQQNGQQQRAIPGDGPARGDERANAGVAEDGAVEPQVHKNGKREQRPQGIDQPLKPFGAVQCFEPQCEGQPHGEQAHACVQGHHHQALGVAGP